MAQGPMWSFGQVTPPGPEGSLAEGGGGPLCGPHLTLTMKKSTAMQRRVRLCRAKGLSPPSYLGPGQGVQMA